MPPPVRIAATACEATSTPCVWSVTWRVENVSRDEITIDDVWVPHVRFKGEGYIRVGLTLEAGEHVDLTLSVAADEPAGTVVEDAFVILRVRGPRPRCSPPASAAIRVFRGSSRAGASSSTHSASRARL